MLAATVTNLADVEKAASLADLVEIRLDHLNDLSFQKPKVPCIFTLRRKEQGGLCDLPEKQRLSLLEECLKLGPEYCDIEADTDPVWIDRMASRFPKIKWIGSYHNFHETPTDLHALLQGMKNPHFSISKIATLAKCSADMLRLMVFAKECAVPISAISLGEYGKPSRVLGKVMGGVLHYAGLDEEVALGRYSLKTLHEVFRFSRLNRDTKIYALVGDPVEQSPGHIFHNAAFQHNGVYVKMRVNKEELGECFSLIRKLGFAGLSVTIPLKEEIVQLVDESSIGAVNTICFQDQKAIGLNTDGLGALNAIEKRQKVQGKRLAILGAGGTARAIAFEAKRRGASFAVFNRTVERARKLGEGYSLDALHSYDYDILINTIPAHVPLKMSLKEKKLVLDVSYNPRETPLLQEALRLGCECIYGDEMFTNQGLLQQQLWWKQAQQRHLRDRGVPPTLFFV